LVLIGWALLALETREKGAVGCCANHFKTIWTNASFQCFIKDGGATAGQTRPAITGHAVVWWTLNAVEGEFKTVLKVFREPGLTLA
jgi:hypothetical protein